MFIVRLLLCLAMAGLAFLVACSPSGVPSASPSVTPTVGSPLPSPSPSVIWFPPTDTPTSLPTVVALPTVELRPGLGEVLLKDGFDDPAHWQSGEFASGNIAMGGNELTISTSAPQAILTSLRDGPELKDFYLEIHFRTNLCQGSNAYGVLFRAASAGDFYRLISTCEGKLRLERAHGAEVAVLKDWTPRLSGPLPTRLGIWASGSDLRFFVDDVLQFEVQDRGLASGAVGVFAHSASDSPLSVSFSDLTVRRVTAPAATLAPTSTPTPTP